MTHVMIDSQKNVFMLELGACPKSPRCPSQPRWRYSRLNKLWSSRFASLYCASKSVAV